MHEKLNFHQNFDLSTINIYPPIKMQYTSKKVMNYIPYPIEILENIKKQKEPNVWIVSKPFTTWGRIVISYLGSVNIPPLPSFPKKTALK